MTVEEIVHAAMCLPAAERIILVRQLALSVPQEEVEPISASEWDAAWSEECGERLRQIEDGEVQEIAGDEVMARVRRLVRP